MTDPSAPIDDPLDAAMAAAFGANDLREPQDSESREENVVPTDAAQLPSFPRRLRRYLIDREIAQGGLSRILLARDLDLGRPIAIKTLKEDLSDRQDLAQRLIEEAQVTGQLQHPGLVPIYEVGALGPGRPYIAMKLVEGETLEAMIAKRAQDDQGLPRFLNIFEKVAQTIAFAHTHGVIHRDLKPANIMVGRFGEVQVMDFGLAKVVRPGSPPDGPRQSSRTNSPVHALSDLPVTTLRSGRSIWDSSAGLVLGTPAYMAPEQGAGRGDSTSPATDVFSLGAILYELLTHSKLRAPADVLAWRESGSLAPSTGALERLNNLPTDAALVVLVRQCLAVEPTERPPTAEAVASAIRSHLEAAAGRAREAEVMAAEARAKASEERRVRRLAIGLAVSIIGAILLAGAGQFWNLREKRARERRTGSAVATALAEAQRSLQVAEGTGRDRVTHLEAALAAAKRAEAVARSGEIDEPTRRAAMGLRQDLEGRRDQALSQSRELARDAAMRRRLDAARADSTTKDALHEAASAAFLEYGVDPKDSAKATTIDRIRTSTISDALLITLDEWTMARRRDHGPDDPLSLKLSEILIEADADALRHSIRNAGLNRDHASLERIAASIRTPEVPPYTLILLASQLWNSELREAARSLLVWAWPRFPSDYDIHLRVGLFQLALEDYPAAVGAFTTAVALRGESVMAWSNLGNSLCLSGRFAEASACHQQALAVEKNLAVLHSNYGATLKRSGNHHASRAAYAEALRLEPRLAEAQHGLAMIDSEEGELDSAEARLRAALDLQPTRADWHYDLATIAQRRRDFSGAIASLEVAVELAPRHLAALTHLGALLMEQKDYAKATSILQRAARVEPGSALPYWNLAEVALRQQDPDHALAILEDAERAEPRRAPTQILRGVALRRRHDLVAAESSFRAALALSPDSSEAHDRLGLLLEIMGRPKEALHHLDKARELGSTRPTYALSSPAVLARVQRMSDLESKILDSSLGEPTSVDQEVDHVMLARLWAAHGGEAKALYHYRAVLDREPRARTTLSRGLRLEGARCALRAAFGPHAPEPGERARAEWRSSALSWFSVEVGVLERLEARNEAEGGRPLLMAWLSEATLAWLRRPAIWSTLSESEQEAWERVLSRAKDLAATLRPEFSK